MRSKSEVLQAVKQFAKEIGAPEAIICDAVKEQTSKALRKFLNNIGSTLRVPEENTPWANKAELHIGLLIHGFHLPGDGSWRKSWGWGSNWRNGAPSAGNEWCRVALWAACRA